MVLLKLPTNTRNKKQNFGCYHEPHLGERGQVDLFPLQDFVKLSISLVWMCQRRKFEWDEGFLTSRFKTRITTRLSRKVGQQQGKKLPRFQPNQMRQFSESLQCEVDKAGSDNNLVVGGKLKTTKNISHNITISSSDIMFHTYHIIYII